MKKNGANIYTKKSYVAPFTQGTWRSNAYVSIIKLVDAFFFYGVDRWTIIYILGGRHKHVKYVQPLLPSYPNITFPSTFPLHEL